MVDGKKLFGESNALQQCFYKEIHYFPLFVLSLKLFCGIFLIMSSLPICHLLSMVDHTNFLLVWGLLRLATINVY